MASVLGNVSHCGRSGLALRVARAASADPCSCYMNRAAGGSATSRGSRADGSFVVSFAVSSCHLCKRESGILMILWLRGHKVLCSCRMCLHGRLETSCCLLRVRSPLELMSMEAAAAKY